MIPSLLGATQNQFGIIQNLILNQINGNKELLFWKHSTYSHLSNNRGGWNKHGGEAKTAKSLNVEVGKYL